MKTTTPEPREPAPDRAPEEDTPPKREPVAAEALVPAPPRSERTPAHTIIAEERDPLFYEVRYTRPADGHTPIFAANAWWHDGTRHVLAEHAALALTGTPGFTLLGAAGSWQRRR